MIVVIQCAASKRSDAGCLVTRDGKPVHFVANTAAVPLDSDRVYARPDDLAEDGISWRDRLIKYNEDSDRNPLNLCPAFMLYKNKAYSRLVDRFGAEKVYILSAGWGLIRSDFLTPYYDITFSPSTITYKRRRQADQYSDFRLPNDIDDEIWFFGGSDYRSLFCSLTSSVRATRTIFYNSTTRPQVVGCKLEHFQTTTRTNWHYECVNAFLGGALER